MSKPVFFIGSSKEDIKDFPEEVRKEIGFSLYLAESGDRAINAVPLAGFGNSMVPEIVVSHQCDAYRAVYTVQFKHAVYVLHAFMKKSKKGIATPKREMDLVRQRLKAAEAHHRANFGQKEKRTLNVSN
ncbi:type II toxin-antitoxin system RelE/ParE family toxin [Mesorhizobium koreense]|uniref:type II toxin-antitoxin system RelE/ParE family toxin n=1 Tax=Mesorhizobium koreense TaxID=3074855 RepID=UPI00287B9827|nr:type II toxin-antitoxin system RelE/ParE family toxin [Mesorhizobium sp. WR6]